MEHVCCVKLIDYILSLCLVELDDVKKLASVLNALASEKHRAQKVFCLVCERLALKVCEELNFWLA